MKTLSYFVSILALFLVLNIIASFSFSSYKTFLKDTKTKIAGEEINKDTVIIDKNTEINERLLDTVDKLNESIENLNKKNTSSGALDETQKKVDTGLPNSLTFKILPEFNAIKTENIGFYDIKNSDTDIKYSTYIDDKKSLKIYVFERGYGELMSIIRNYSKYKINETNNFYGYSFYINPTLKDNKIRFVVQLEAKSVGFEIINTNYEELKKLLLK